MFAGILITIREGLEAFLVVGILLGYLTKLKQQQYFKYVWAGSLVGILASTLIAYAFQILKIELKGVAAEVFEVSVAVIAIAVLSYMIVWMQKQSKDIKGNLQSKVNNALSKKQVWGIAVLAFVTVIREGIETALFLTAVTGDGLLIGAVIGLILAAVMAVLLFKSTVKLELKKFFLVTGLLLIFVAAGLVSHSVHALGELGIVPQIVEHVWNFEWVISNASLLGRLLHAFIGYESSPSLMQAIAYSGYLLVIGKIFVNNLKTSARSTRCATVQK